MTVSKTKNITSKSDKLLHSGNLELKFFLSPECNSNQAQAVPGCGGLSCDKSGMAVRKFRLKTLKEISLGVARATACLTHKRCHLKCHFRLEL